MLHIVNCSKSNSSPLDQCLEVFDNTTDTLLLIGDSVLLCSNENIDDRLDKVDNLFLSLADIERCKMLSWIGVDLCGQEIVDLISKLGNPITWK